MTAPNTNTAIQPRIQEYIRSNEIMQKFIDLLGQNGAAGYVQSVLLAVSDSKDLMACTPTSVTSCALRAATMKLSCDPTTKQAYLVPFKKSIKQADGSWLEVKIATLIVGYMGFYQMAIRTGKYRYVNIYPVHGNQEVVENPISGFHSIKRTEGDKDVIIGYLGAFEMGNGYGKTLYMSVEELAAHGKQYSKGYNDPKGKWQTDPHSMYKKTVMRMLLIHWGYLDPHDVASLVEAEAEADNNAQIIIDAEPLDMEEEAKVSEKQTMADLGYPDEQPTTTPAAETKAPEVVEPAKEKAEEANTGTPAMTFSQACAIKNSEGKLYGNLEDEKLRLMKLGLGKVKNPTEEQITKMIAIGIIQEMRAASIEEQDEAAREAFEE